MSSPGLVDPVGLASRLVRIDSSTPDGGRGCIELIAATLADAGVQHRVLAETPSRPNLIARVPGRGDAPPLLLYGHVDVVAASEAGWRHPPFSGAVVGGEIWGRGTLDMKGGLAMLVSAIVDAARQPIPPAGDLLLAATCDEETGGRHGAGFLVSEHADLFGGVRHAISEFGGYTHHVAGRRLYPIQVAQKRRCLLELTARGPSGHSATPRKHQPIGTLAHGLARLERRLPAHITPPVRTMIEAMAAGLPAGQALALRALLHPRLTDLVLRAAGAQAEDLEPLFRNTAVATVVNAGDASNVSPPLASATVDGRLLPGHEPEELVAELRALLGSRVEIEVRDREPPTRTTIDPTMLGLLASVLRDHDPAAHPFPLVAPGMTDARHFDRLGIQTYGFLPMRLPPGLMPGLIHGIDERIPAAALRDGTAALGQVITRYHNL